MCSHCYSTEFIIFSKIMQYIYCVVVRSDYEGNMPARYLRHGSQPEDFPVIRTTPMLEPFWAAGFSFSRGHFKLRVPYDAYQPMVFQVRLRTSYVMLMFMFMLCFVLTMRLF
jgi:hypothetical protein